MRAVHGAVVQVQQVGAAQLAQQGGVQAGPDTGLGQSRSRCQAVTPKQPTLSEGTSRQAAPVRSTYMASKRRSVGKTQPARMATATPLGSGGQQRRQPLPQVVGNKINTHSGHLADQDRRGQDPQLAVVDLLLESAEVAL